MKKRFAVAMLGMFPLFAGAAGPVDGPMSSDSIAPWRRVVVPTLAEEAAAFPSPPKEYGAIHWAIWGGQQSKERILADIEHVYAAGGGVYMINNSRGLMPKYFTPEYLGLVRFVVDECKKRGMKVWIEGEAGYPDGFAGGMISKLYPQLGMQAIVADARYTVALGQTLSIPLPTDTLGILAAARPEATGGQAAQPPAQPDAQSGTAIPLPADGMLKWTGPSGGTWDVTIRGDNSEGHYSVVAGQTLSLKLAPGTKSIEANPRAGGRGRGGAGRAAQPPTVLPIPGDGQFKYTNQTAAPCEITFVRHVYRSSPTRFSNREDGTSDKDSLYSLIDYLDPNATATYLKLIFDTYEKTVGDEFGKTVLGFRGDETDYTGIIPWTPKLLETFKSEKGYDLQPYLPLFFAGQLTPEARKAKADYWDVWSGMFRDNFYKPIEQWCNARGMEYMMHLNHEETMLSPAGGEGMITNEGSFWRDMRYVGVPGIDNLNQIGPGIVADFPKLAASAAHMNGRAMVWEEEMGGTGQNGKFIIDYQLVRGVNYGNIRGMNAAPPADPKPLQDSAAATGWYLSRSQYLLATGRPAAQVALFHATDSYWLGDQEADTVQLKIATELMEHQIDFDHIDADALATVCTLESGGLKNLSGQIYHAVIVPTSTVIQKNVLERLKAFAAAGGKVIFVGRTPTMVADKTFLDAGGPPDLGFATLEPTAEITEKVIAALPAPDVKLDSPCPPLKYIHRAMKDGDLYFFFNESAKPQTRTATLTGSGAVQVWDATSGTIHPLVGISVAGGRVAVPLALGPQEARFIVIGPLPANAAQPWPTLAGAQTVANLDGDWTITLGDKTQTTSLKPWQDLGADSFNGIATYLKKFPAPAGAPQGQKIYLDLGDVHEIAHVRMNGTDLESRGWQPYVWDITQALKEGENTLEIQVQLPLAGGRGFGGGAGAPGGTAQGGAAAGNAAARRGGLTITPGATTNPTPRGRAGRGRGAGGGLGASAAAPVVKGLLGPVRLIEE